MCREIDKRKTMIQKLLSERYEEIMINEKRCFLLSNGMVISVDTIGEDHLVVEYADNVKEACLFRFEDGDSFWIGESDIDMMIQKVFREIELSSSD